MLNPFLQPVPTEKHPKKTKASDAMAFEVYGHSLDTSSPRSNVGLLVGKLLIRMGEKLVKEENGLKSTRENA